MPSFSYSGYATAYAYAIVQAETQEQADRIVKLGLGSDPNVIVKQWVGFEVVSKHRKISPVPKAAKNTKKGQED